MKLSFCFITLLLLGFEAHAQAPDQEAKPVVGWDSLSSVVEYPLLARRASVQGYVEVTVELDSSGRVKDVKACGYDIFHDTIVKAVKSVKWFPEVPYRSIPSTVHFEVQFNMKGLTIPERRMMETKCDTSYSAHRILHVEGDTTFAPVHIDQ